MRLRRSRMTLDELRSGVAGRVDQILVERQIGKAQKRHAALALAEELTRPAQGEIAPCDFEPIAALEHHLHALAAGGRKLVAEEQDAHAVARAAAYAPAQL